MCKWQSCEAKAGILALELVHVDLGRERGHLRGPRGRPEGFGQKKVEVSSEEGCSLKLEARPGLMK